jgi:hypothetical protein
MIKFRKNCKKNPENEGLKKLGAPFLSIFFYLEAHIVVQIDPFALLSSKSYFP